MELQNMQGRAHMLPSNALYVIKRDGSSSSFDEYKIIETLQRACVGFEQDVDMQRIIDEVRKNIFDGISVIDLEQTCIMAACSFIECDPAYGKVAARLLLQKLSREILGIAPHEERFAQSYRDTFIATIHKGIAYGYFDTRLAEFDLELLSKAIDLQRDSMLDYMGLHTLTMRYFLKHEGVRWELPQMFWMRIAMGLAILEDDKNRRALEFYEILSTLRYTTSTPTLFHSGFPCAQLSSCYLNTVKDDLGHIFKVTGDNAQLSKWAGGIGTDWTNIRATGAYIKGIKATSQGVIPYLKIANDVVVCITRSGIRRGGTCAYLETWHYDIEEFLDLRRNTGDDRRRTHDLNTANWIPDLFMKRVEADAMWTLFSPHDVPDLHELYGKAFEKRYEEYEALAAAGTIKLTRKIPAKQLWRKMLTRLFETGHPWITFKDACNVRSPQDHVGVIHSSNLCTEITLNTSEDETAVCNLGSLNCGQHVVNGVLDETKLRETIFAAVRMLDNVVDLNFYPTREAEISNKRHRPIGLGLMGLQDAMFMLNIPFSSKQALEFSDRLMEKISYYAIQASASLAEERGAYSTFKGSKWDRGIFPLDTLDLLEQERGQKIEVNRTSTLDWDGLKQRVKQVGIRNSNVMAIAPTATIATITGCYPCIEPIYKNIYVKSNVSGEFTIINSYLVKDLKDRGLWTTETMQQLKYYDGDCSKIKAIPDDIKLKYQTAFELDPEWLIDIAAVRSKWIDQSQSMNSFVAGVSGAKLDSLYRRSWRLGLKTNYYLRTLGATQIEKATLDSGKFGYTQKREYSSYAESSADMQQVQENLSPETELKRQACALNPGECESCQ
jgi:ribonucleoside-diphosphate reductase alpha chain